jgi:hypothetical protein
MPDILCAICSEPWDYYGVNSGDMNKWEAVLFKLGTGCPCCEGKSDELDDATHIEVLRSRINNESPMLPNVGFKPKWTRPDDIEVVSCECCTSKIMKSVDDGEMYYNRCKSHPYRYSEPDADPSEFEKWSRYKTVCTECQIGCSECGTQLDKLSTDPYEGMVMLMSDDHYGKEPLCVECYSVKSSYNEELSELYDIEREYRMSNPFEDTEGVEVYISVTDDFPNCSLEIEVCQDEDSSIRELCYSEIANWGSDRDEKLEEFISNIIGGETC